MAKQGAATVTPRLRFPEFRGANEWTAIELQQLAEVVTKRVGATECIPYTITSGVGLVSQQEKLGRTIAGNSLKNYLLLQRNDFAYNKSATKAFPQGFIARYIGDERAAVPNSIFTCFRTNDETIDPVYLDGLFSMNLHGNWLRSRIAVGARAHGSLNVSDEDLMALPVPLPVGPSSLAEQKKIAGCLKSLDEVIAAQGRTVEVLKVHRRGLMQQLLPGGETGPRLRFPKFRNGARGTKVAFRKIIDVASGQVDPTVSPYSDLPHVGGENIESDSGSISDVKTARELRLISGKYLFDERDVLYSKIRPALNKVATPNFQGICSADIYPLRPSNDTLCRDYLVCVLRSDSFLRYATKHSERGKIPKINRHALLAYEVILPALEEQQRVASCISSLDTQIAAQISWLATLKAHKQGLMQQIFPAPEGGS